MPRKKTALLLTGGGARAAYQVGALKAIASLYPRNHGLPFPIICGTSAGAINGSALAAYASCFRLGLKKLEYIWGGFSSEQVYECSWDQLLQQWGRMVLNNMRASYGPQHGFALFNNQPLRQLLHRVIDFERIDLNILRGHLEAFSITASDDSTGHSITFFQGQHELQNWQRAKREGRRCVLHTEHLLASAAIPMMFPPIQVGQDYYGDGSVHQISPLSPAIHLGAEQILVLGVEQPYPESPTELQRSPSSADIMGHMLNTIFADTLDSDVERLERINETLDLMTDERRSQLPLKPISLWRLENQHDLDQIARQYYDDIPWPVRLLLSGMGAGPDSNSSICSYVMFEQRYTRHLIELGYQDAIAKKDELRDFLQI